MDKVSLWAWGVIKNDLLEPDIYTEQKDTFFSSLSKVQSDQTSLVLGQLEG